MGLLHAFNLVLARTMSRLYRLDRRYAAAKLDRLTGDWLPADQGVNELIRGSAPILRARIRQLVRDFPFFARAVNVLVDDTVGAGVRLQARVRGIGGQPAKAINQGIEDAWRFWADEADETGRLHLDELMRLAKRQEVETGETLLVKVRVNDPGRYLPFALRLYEPDQLSSLATVTTTGNEIMGGVEYDRASGRVVAYWLEDPGSWGKPRRVPAAEVIHHFDLLRPGQLRGVSVFAPAVLVAKDLDEYMGSEVDAAKTASKFLAMVTTPTPAVFQNGNTAANPQKPDQRIEELENAVIQYLQPGEEVRFAKHERPSGGMDRFAALVLRMVAVTIDISYQRLSGDYSGINYSTSKSITNDQREAHKSRQSRFYRGTYRPLFHEFLSWAVIKGRLSLPGYWQNPAPFHQVQWFGPPLRSNDPLKEGRGWRELISLGVISPNRWPWSWATTRTRFWNKPPTS